MTCGLPKRTSCDTHFLLLRFLLFQRGKKALAHRPGRGVSLYKKEGENKQRNTAVVCITSSSSSLVKKMRYKHTNIQTLLVIVFALPTSASLLLTYLTVLTCLGGSPFVLSLDHREVPSKHLTNSHTHTYTRGNGRRGEAQWKKTVCDDDSRTLFFAVCRFRCSKNLLVSLGLSLASKLPLSAAAWERLPIVQPHFV